MPGSDAIMLAALMNGSTLCWACKDINNMRSSQRDMILGSSHCHGTICSTWSSRQLHLRRRSSPVSKVAVHTVYLTMISSSAAYRSGVILPPAFIATSRISMLLNSRYVCGRPNCSPSQLLHLIRTWSSLMTLMRRCYTKFPL
jgi:hypothetical protein